MTGFDRDRLTDDGHQRRIALGEVDTKIDRSAKANGRDQVAKAEEVGLGRDGEVVLARRDRAVVEDAEYQFHRRDVNFFLLSMWQTQRSACALERKWKHKAYGADVG